MPNEKQRFWDPLAFLRVVPSTCCHFRQVALGPEQSLLGPELERRSSSGCATLCLDFSLDGRVFGPFRPEVLVVAAEHGAAQGENRVGASDGPVHP